MGCGGRGEGTLSHGPALSLPKAAPSLKTGSSVGVCTGWVWSLLKPASSDTNTNSFPTLPLLLPAVLWQIPFLLPQPRLGQTL